MRFQLNRRVARQDAEEDGSDPLEEEINLHATFVTLEERTIWKALDSHDQSLDSLRDVVGVLQEIFYEAVHHVDKHGLC